MNFKKITLAEVLFLFFGTILAFGQTFSEPLWPTPSSAFEKFQPIEKFIQPTASGKIESGLFGCVRSGGKKFHEGIDIKPLYRNKKGEPTDAIFASWDGTVAYVCSISGKSNYGRYVVIEHNGLTPAVYTLYAHLASVTPGLKAGDPVKAGSTIGVMGRSALPPIHKDRAHLHFEIGLRLSDQFDGWYIKQKKFAQRNEHGNFNGMNLMGIDPLALMNEARYGMLTDLSAYIQSLPTAFTVYVAYAKVPSFLKRYPTFLDGPVPTPGTYSGWEIEFTSYGLPKRWKTIKPTTPLKPGSITVVSYNEGLLKAGCRKTIVLGKNKKCTIGNHLQDVVDILFYQSK
jgi:peptidoglycan LD-endopeptidase LytH